MYESHFGLVRRPFAAAAAPQWYFPAAAIESARQTLGRCIERAAGIGFVVGPTGTGKTMLLEVLAAEFADRFQVARIANGHLTTRRTLLQTILFELGLRYRQRDEGELRLELIERLTRSEPPVPGLLLLIDEAHTLPLRLLEEVRMITNLVRGGQPCVRLVLAGSPVLEERFTSPRLDAFNQRLAARCYLETLSYAETGGYVRHQIEAAGGAADRVVSPEALAAIHRATDGVPRLVNQLADHALLLAYADGARRLEADIVAQAWSDLQQLPAPWGVETRTTQAETAAPVAAPAASYSSIEFGSLDDELEDESDEPAATSSIEEPAAPPAVACALHTSPSPAWPAVEEREHYDAEEELPAYWTAVPQPEPVEEPAAPQTASCADDDTEEWQEDAVVGRTAAVDSPVEPAHEEVVQDRYAALDAARQQVPTSPPAANTADMLAADVPLTRPDRRATADRAAEEKLSLAEALVRLEIERTSEDPAKTVDAPPAGAVKAEADANSAAITASNDQDNTSQGRWPPAWRVDGDADLSAYSQPAEPSASPWQPAAELPQAPALEWEDTGHGAALAAHAGAEPHDMALATEPTAAQDEDLIVVEPPVEPQPTVAAEPVRRHEYRQLFRRLRGDQR
jgi:type II secretory pathway predicted ATPase ExeA